MKKNIIYSQNIFTINILIFFNELCHLSAAHHGLSEFDANQNALKQTLCSSENYINKE